MKHLYFLLFLLFLSLSAFSQLRLNYNRIRPGDKLVKQQVEYKDPGKAGEGILWNFSSLKTIQENYAVTYSLPQVLGDSLYVMGSNAYPVQEFTSDSDLILAKENHTQYFYCLKGDTLEMLGHENPVVRYNYTLPYVQTVFPLDYGGFYAYPYRAKGMYSGRDSISTSGYVSTFADARGRMILPSGDTLSQVLRVKTCQSIINNLDTVLSRKQRVLETCRWYTKGYRYPVFETVRSYNLMDSTVYFKTAFFYPPQDHYYLADDPANQAILDSLWNDKTKEPADNSDSNSRSLSIAGILSCKMYPNPVETNLTVDYEVTMAANISFGMYSIEGFPISTIPAKHHEPGSYSVSFNCSGLYPRNYVLRVIANDKVANGVIIKK